jgi:predicted extracellular nuclease
MHHVVGSRAFAGLLFAFLLRGVAAAQVVINEIDYDQPLTDTAEFVEIVNAGLEPVSLAGFQLQFYNGATNPASSYRTIPITVAALAPGAYLVVCGNAANVSDCDIDASPDNDLIQNGAPDAVALLDGAGFPVDVVSYEGDALPFVEGSGVGLLDDAAIPGKSISRCPNGGDTNQNNVDFVYLDATPGATNACAPPPPPPLGRCGEPSVPIHLIQGNGPASPVAGELRIVEGVVVGDFQGPAGINGFFVQEEDAQTDGDPATSEGIFAFDGPSGSPVGAGDVVRVGGIVAEFSGLTELTSLIGVEVCSPGAGGASASTVMLPVDAVTDLERFEGMLVQFPQELFATGNFNLGRFGEVDLSVGDRLFIPTAITTPGSSAAALQDLNRRSRIVLDDGSNLQNPLPLPPYLAEDGTLRAGDRTSNVAGVLSFEFGAYRVHPTGPVSFERLNDRPAAPPAVGGTLKVASFNVLNYFTTLDGSGPICGPTGGLDCRGADNENEFARQREKILAAMSALDADVVGIIEVENNDSESVQDLVNGLNDILGPGTYDFIDTGTVGTDAIKVGFIYKPGSVTPVGITATLEDVFPFDTNTRPPIAQTFEESSTGRRLTVVVNHFKSKGSPCDADPDVGDGQGNCNLTRVAAALRLLAWLGSDPTGTGNERVLILGDLNAYAKEDPIAMLESSGYTNLVDRFLGPSAYSYVFAGESGYLDHALANPGLLPFVTGAAEWHINADEPVALDYNTEFNQPLLYQPGAFRSSDHDPVIVGLDLQPVRNVDIDIRPFFHRNLVIPGSNMPVGVAILSEDGFDATSVDIATVRFGPAGAAPSPQSVFVDVDRDGLKDSVLFFRTRDTGIGCDDTEASLAGFTFDGTKISGTDDIVTFCVRKAGP